jgi:hypothetical protein
VCRHFKSESSGSGHHRARRQDAVSQGTLLRSFIKIERLSLDADGQETEVTRTVTPLAVVYGFYPKWTVVASQPYLSVNSTTGAAESNVNGLPDAQLILQYDGLYSRNSPGGLTRLSGVFGLQLPTGAERFSTGALAYTGGLIFEKAVRLKYVLTADFQYTVTTQNIQGARRGNSARFDLVPAYFLMTDGTVSADGNWFGKLFDRLFRQGAYFVLELNGTWQSRARNGGLRNPDTGGTTLSLSPGIQYFLSNRLLVEASAPIPVIKEFNGSQLEPESTVLFGLRFLF